MIAAISQRRDKNKHGIEIDNLEASYIDYFSKFRITLVIIPNFPNLVSDYFSKFNIDRMILTGGNDVSPLLYGKNQELGSASKERDATERELLKIAVKKRIPVLGICRGMQFINVYFRGKLADVKDISKGHLPGINHEIIVEKFGKTKVNSYHNCCISKDTLSKELKAFAIAGNVIEGIYHPKLPIAGIEWHPERKSPDEEINKKFIQAFLKRELFWK